MRLGEADRILHLYTAERGRVSAVAKGIRKTKSRYGARLEPLSYVAIQLHQGSGELQTVTGVDLIGSHTAVREDTYRLGVGLIGAEAMLRLFTEQEKNERAFTALAKFLDALEEPSRCRLPGGRRTRLVLPAETALALRLPAAPHDLRRVRCRGRAARRLLAEGGRCRLSHVRGGSAAAQPGGDRRDRAAARPAALRGAGHGPDRPRGA